LLKDLAAREIGACQFVPLGTQLIEAGFGLISGPVLLAGGRTGDVDWHAVQQLLQRRFPLLGLQDPTLGGTQLTLHVGASQQKLRDLLLQVCYR
jgi:hypothetical protein